jgi:hypothetical protein
VTQTQVPSSSATGGLEIKFGSLEVSPNESQETPGVASVNPQQENVNPHEDENLGHNASAMDVTTSPALSVSTVVQQPDMGDTQLPSSAATMPPPMAQPVRRPWADQDDGTSVVPPATDDDGTSFASHASDNPFVAANLDGCLTGQQNIDREQAVQELASLVKENELAPASSQAASSQDRNDQPASGDAAASDPVASVDAEQVAASASVDAGATLMEVDAQGADHMEVDDENATDKRDQSCDADFSNT